MPSGRTPRQATPEDWIKVEAAFERSLDCLPTTTPRLISIDDDGLLMAALSPRTNPEESDDVRLARVSGLVETLLQRDPLLGVALCVDELCPRGIDLSLGARAIERLLDGGVTEMLWTTGSRALASLRNRPREQTRWDVWSSAVRYQRQRLERDPPAGLWMSGPANADLRLLGEDVIAAGFSAVVVSEDKASSDA